MKNFILIIFGVLFSSVLFGQSKSQIISEKITSIKTYEQELSKGLDKKYIVEESTYDSKGRLLELKELNSKGDIKLWEKFKFDENGNLVEEIIYDIEGKIKKKEITFYTNNLRTHREFYDSRGRKYKIKTYEYKFNK
jgi:hypothetical protein